MIQIKKKKKKKKTEKFSVLFYIELCTVSDEIIDVVKQHIWSVEHWDSTPHIVSKIGNNFGRLVGQKNEMA